MNCSTKKLGIYYDELMKLHFSHDYPHYECPERFDAIITHLTKKYNLFTKD